MKLREMDRDNVGHGLEGALNRYGDQNVHHGHDEPCTRYARDHVPDGNEFSTSRSQKTMVLFGHRTLQRAMQPGTCLDQSILSDLAGMGPAAEAAHLNVVPQQPSQPHPNGFSIKQAMQTGFEQMNASLLMTQQQQSKRGTPLFPHMSQVCPFRRPNRCESTRAKLHSRSGFSNRVCKAGFSNRVCKAVRQIFWEASQTCWPPSPIFSQTRTPSHPDAPTRSRCPTWSPQTPSGKMGPSHPARTLVCVRVRRSDPAERFQVLPSSPVGGQSDQFPVLPKPPVLSPIPNQLSTFVEPIGTEQ